MSKGLSERGKDLDLKRHCLLCAMVCACREQVLTTCDWNPWRHTKPSVDSPQERLGSRSKKICRLCQKIHVSCHIHMLLDKELPVMVRAIRVWPNLPLPSTLNFFCVQILLPREEKKKNQKTTWIVSRNSSSYDSKIHGGQIR